MQYSTIPQRAHWSEVFFALLITMYLLGFAGNAQAFPLRAPSPESQINQYASLSPTTYILSVRADHGSVQKTPDLPVYEEGSTVIVTAVSDDGYSFTGWTGDVVGTTNPLVLAMTSDRSITANFNNGKKLIFEHDGLTREYLFYKPDNLPKNAPLVFLLHAYRGIVEDYRDLTGMNLIGDANKFAVCYPQGSKDPDASDWWSTQPHWNPRYNNCTVDDIGFLSKLAAFLQTQESLDPQRTFVCGASNGGIMAYTLACEEPYAFKAVASVAGTMSAYTWENREAARPVPVLEIHGAADDVVPIDGSQDSPRGWAMVPTDTILEFWANLNACTTSSTAMLTPSTTAYYDTGGVNGNEVWYYTIADYGHDWPGKPWHPDGDASGINASEVIWEFFSKYAKAPPTFTLSVETEHGSVQKTPDLPGYEEGSNVTLTASPDAMYEFTGWSRDATGTTNPLVLTITDDLTIAANFASISHKFEGNWTWMKGTDTTGTTGTYGTQGVPDPANMPDGRMDAVSWTDADGNFWLFGGGTLNKLFNDLWTYNPATGNWTWMKGSPTDNTTGTYGTLGVPDPANAPGKRDGAIPWTGESGALWLFGGGGYDSTGTHGLLNDLWKYDIATGNWTWMKGDDTCNTTGTYGTLGVPDVANTPCARRDSVSWTDSTGALWLYGGGLEYWSVDLSDLWKYTPSTGNWTWMKGSDTVRQPAIYGSLETPDPANTPGARGGAISWTDNEGDLWLFGGVGRNLGVYNDLWKFEPDTGNWTWMKGSDIANQPGISGSLGVPDSANTPGSRWDAISWVDDSGSLWLFGGSVDVVDIMNPILFSDLWKYTPATGNWTWMKGPNTSDQPGVYGLLGVPDPANNPDPRWRAVSWKDNSGSLWLFGGGNYSWGSYGDLWKYTNTSTETTRTLTIEIEGDGEVTTNPVGSVFDTYTTVALTAVPGDMQVSSGWTGHVPAGQEQANPLILTMDADRTVSARFKRYTCVLNISTIGKGTVTTDPDISVFDANTTVTLTATPATGQQFAGWTGGTPTLQDHANPLVLSMNGDQYIRAVFISENPGFEGNWTWMKGYGSEGQSGVYGELGEPDLANNPGARSGAISGADKAGMSWVFGGYGYDEAGNLGYLNDLWRWDSVTRTWTWVKGSGLANQPGTYGTLGASEPANTPGARSGAVSWIDDSGALWLFGGYGIDNEGNPGALLNDLWRYDSGTGDWVWMNGSDTCDTTGTYGTIGVPHLSNTPGARAEAVSWIDKTGALWLFGGHGLDGAGKLGMLNDLWKYNPNTRVWTWMKGSDAKGQYGVYGTLGVSDPANTPGSRDGAVSWVDNSGSLWLFGGGWILNDLWKFNPATGNWTWMKGSTKSAGMESYGTLGVSDPANTPCALKEAVSWTDDSGVFWLYGGTWRFWMDDIYFNDLWKFDPATGDWTWMKGSGSENPSRTYGTLGIPAQGYTPAGLEGATSWTDASGSLWLFGGSGTYVSSGYHSLVNSLWRYDLITGNWTWVKSDIPENKFGDWGMAGVPDSANTPSGRISAVNWSDSAGGLWLFGGDGLDKVGNKSTLNDLWKYNPATGNWSWLKGSDTYTTGTYGTLGVPDPANSPGAREEAVSWIDKSGGLWLFGGHDYADYSRGKQRMFNDLWKFEPSTGNWAWMKGSDTKGQEGGIYGTLGVPDPANTPGARWKAVSWTDDAGVFWLFGGSGSASSGEGGNLNDLWKFDPSTHNWTWMKGSNKGWQHGKFGTLGIPDPANTPSGRTDAVSWVDASGYLWLFGGYDEGGRRNDLWRYDSDTGNWTWMKGSVLKSQPGVYGRPGIPDPGNTPGARSMAVSWTDNSGALWLLGGWGYSSEGRPRGELNDLWKYTPATGNWTWVKGFDIPRQHGTCGTLYTPDDSNTPGGRKNSICWTDDSGTLWLFGGEGYDAVEYKGYLNDLWKYTPASEKATRTLTIEIEGDGAVSTDPDGNIFDTFSTVTLTATPGDEIQFAAWSGHVPMGHEQDNPLVLMMDANRTITAHFERRKELSITVLGSGFVLTNPTGPFFDTKTTVSLTAEPLLGHQFIGWSGDIPAGEELINPLSIFITTDAAITASFEQITYNLDVAIDGGGSVSTFPVGSVFDAYSTISLLTTPNTGQQFIGWSGDAPVGKERVSVLSMLIEKDMKLTAHFRPTTHTIYVDVVGAGTIEGVPDAQFYSYGSSLTLAAQSEPGNFFTGWSRFNTSDNLTSNPLTFFVDSDTTITAHFAPDPISTWTLTFVAAEGGIVEKVPGLIAYTDGSSVTLSAIPEIGHHFVNWTGDVAPEASRANPLVLIMDGDKTVTANFAITTYTLSITAAGGSVDTAPGRLVFDAGTTVTLTASPETGYDFAGWTGDASGLDDPITIIMDNNKNIEARFVLRTYALTLNTIDGSASASPSAPEYDHGSVVSVTATPAANCHFIGWSGSASGMDNPLMVMMDEPKSIQALFALDTCAVTAIASEGGAVFVSPDVAEHDFGSTVSVTATPDTGCAFVNWTGDVPAGMSGTNPLILTVDGAKSLTALFRELPEAATYKITYSRCQACMDEEGNLALTNTEAKSSIKIQKQKKPPKSMEPKPGKYFYVAGLQVIPEIVIDGSFGKFYTDADVWSLVAAGTVKSISTKAANIEWIEAASIGSIKNTALVDTAAGKTATCSVMLTDANAAPMKVAFTGIILENLMSAQSLKSLTVASKVYRDSETREKIYSLGGIGAADRAVAQAAGQPNLPLEDDSIISAPSIATITAKGAPLTPDTIEAGLTKIKVQGGVFKTTTLVTIKADLVVRRLISSTPIKSITAKAKNVSGQLIGGRIGVLGSPHLMRVQAAGDITTIIGQDIAAIIWAGFTGDLPTHTGMIKKITSKGTLAGEVHMSPNPKLPKIKAQDQADFKVVTQ